MSVQFFELIFFSLSVSNDDWDHHHSHNLSRIRRFASNNLLTVSLYCFFIFNLSAEFSDSFFTSLMNIYALFNLSWSFSTHYSVSVMTEHILHYHFSDHFEINSLKATQSYSLHLSFQVFWYSHYCVSVTDRFNSFQHIRKIINNWKSVYSFTLTSNIRSLSSHFHLIQESVNTYQYNNNDIFSSSDRYQFCQISQVNNTASDFSNFLDVNIISNSL